MIKNLTMAGAALSLLVAAPALAGEPVKAAHPAKVAQVKRARAAADPRKAQDVAGLSLPVLLIGAVTVGVGIASAGGLLTTSP